jgi:hypothetical protein
VSGRATAEQCGVYAVDHPRPPRRPHPNQAPRPSGQTQRPSPRLYRLWRVLPRQVHPQQAPRVRVGEHLGHRARVRAAGRRARQRRGEALAERSEVPHVNVRAAGPLGGLLLGQALWGLGLGRPAGADGAGEGEGSQGAGEPEQTRTLACMQVALPCNRGGQPVPPPAPLAARLQRWRAGLLLKPGAHAPRSPGGAGQTRRWARQSGRAASARLRCERGVRRRRQSA